MEKTLIISVRQAEDLLEATKRATSKTGGPNMVEGRDVAAAFLQVVIVEFATPEDPAGGIDVILLQDP